MSRRTRILATSALVIALAIAGYAALRKPPAPPLRPIDPSAQPEGPARQLAELLLSAPQARALSPRPQGRAYVALRRDGVRLADAWAGGEDFQRAALAAVVQASRQVSDERSADAIELCLPYDLRGLSLRAKRPPMGNVHRGVRGMVLRLGKQEQWSCPTQMIAENRDFKKLAQSFQQIYRLTPESFADEVQAERFEAHQLLVDLEQQTVTPMHRGNTVVPLSAVNRESVGALADGMAEWLVRQVHEDGRMTYMYYPSRGEEPLHLNNMIRQFMASLALVRLAKFRKDAEIEALALRNLRYNFAQFYQEHEGLGVITFRNKSKLGSAALAALGIVEAPFRGALARFEEPLIRTTTHMQQPDGSFHTFFGTTRNDNQNFYPGETLLLWSTLLVQAPDEALMERFMRAFRYYRAWHRKNTNPAFIPWHTQAYFNVWRLTRDQELADFIFEMNDFLAGFQEWDGSRYPDTQGRFYDDDRRHFGPPHASSTGVYLEGLIDAYELAVELKDEERRERYRTTIRRALRSLMQLQFTDAVDTYYITKKERVLGGLRTTVYDNRIRVDNVQHSLMGLLKTLPIFERDNAF